MLNGGGGFGKTRLAIEYFHRMGPIHYPGGNIWIDASGTAEGMDLAGQLEGLDAHLRSVADHSARADERHPANAIMAGTTPAESQALSLRHFGRQPVLYIVDNLPDLGAHGNMADYCPAEKEVSLVFTSRREVAWNNVARVAVDTLPSGDSIRLLQRGLSNPQAVLGQSEWDALAEAVGDLPIVLEILNAHFKTIPGSAKGFLARVARSDDSRVFDEAVGELQGIVPEGALRGISEAFRGSFEALVDLPRFGGRECGERCHLAGSARLPATPRPLRWLRDWPTALAHPSCKLRCPRRSSRDHVRPQAPRETAKVP